MKTQISYLIGLIVFFLPCMTLTAQVQENFRKEMAELRPELDRNIEKYRKGDILLKLTDEKGNPLSNQKINIYQDTHTFRFGCNILVLGQMQEKNAMYEQEFLRLFNLATTTLCCRAYHPKEGKYILGEGEQNVWRRPQPDSVLAFCKKNGIELKGQPVIAGSWHPFWMSKDREVAKSQYRKWMKVIADRYGKEFAIFDLVNESQCHKGKGFSLYEEKLEYVAWAFKEAKKLFPPEATLEINEATGYAHNPNIYLKQLLALQAEGAKFDSVGFQFHMFSIGQFFKGKTYTPKSLFNLYNKYCQLQVPLYITEITIPSTFGKTQKEGEAIQAETLENLYRLWFSIPNMAGIIYWNLCDGAAFAKEGDVLAGLIDTEMREKPAYQVLYQLIQREWKTNLPATTNDKGEITFRGFYGKYHADLNINGEKQRMEFSLSQGGKPVSLVIHTKSKDQSSIKKEAKP